MWYQGDYTEEMSMQAWEFVLGRYQNRWNVFAADIRSDTALMRFIQSCIRDRDRGLYSEERRFILPAQRLPHTRRIGPF